MIASFSNGLIFIKTRKTGGTSVELVLATWCSGHDLCTPMPPADEEIRRQMGGHPPKAEHKGVRIFNHMPARAVKELLPKLWERAHKVTLERHPYEKVVSRAFWNIGRRGGDPAAEFQQEVDAALADPRTYIDRSLYMVGDKLAVDEVLLHHRLDEQLPKLAERFGKAMPAEVPHAKGSHRTDRRPAAEILSEAQKERIRKDADFEFRTFGFEP